MYSYRTEGMSAVTNEIVQYKHPELRQVCCGLPPNPVDVDCRPVPKTKLPAADWAGWVELNNPPVLVEPACLALRLAL